MFRQWYAIASNKALSIRAGTKYVSSVTHIRSTALVFVLATSVAADAVAQTSTAKGLWCGEPHKTKAAAPWSVSGNGWAASCNGTADCDRVMQAHNCTSHGQCTGATTSADAITNIIVDGVSRAVTTLPTEQALGVIGTIGIFGAMLNSSNASNAAAVKAAADARAAEEAAARARAEEQARKDREMQEYLQKNLKGLTDAPTLRAKLETSPGALQPKLTRGAFGTNAAPTDAVSKIQRPQSARDVSTAWKQLWCANDIAQKAAGASTLEEILYLTNEARGAIEGVSWGEGCRAAPAVPTISPQAVPARTAALKSAVVELAAVAEKAAAPVPAAAPLSPASSNAAATSAQTDDDRRIAEVFRQQQENERRLDEKIAPVREAQKIINALGAIPEVPPEPDVRDDAPAEKQPPKKQ
jgi:hypothetical protein